MSNRSIYSIHNNESYLKDRVQVIYHHVLRLRIPEKKNQKNKFAVDEDLQQVEPELEQVQEQPLVLQ
jgi:hypothetical protein